MPSNVPKGVRAQSWRTMTNRTVMQSTGTVSYTHLSILLGDVKRLMGVKALDLHKPVVSRGVGGEEIETGADGENGRHVFLNRLTRLIGLVLKRA